MESFSPKLDILPKHQQSLWEKFDQLPDHYVLYGGTALALQLGHRVSEDFDFFTNQTLNEDPLRNRLDFWDGATVIQKEPDALTVLLEDQGNVKCSFFAVPELGRVSEPLMADDNKVAVASLLDLFATKLAVLLQRVEKKDYLDISALIDSGMTLEEGISAMKTIYESTFPPAEVARTLTFFEESPLDTLPEEVKENLISASKNLPSELPETPLRSKKIR